MPQRKLSIVTIAFNNREGLIRTVESVRRQTYENIEYMVIDGGSTDGSLDYLRSLKCACITLVSESDRGIYHAMQKGLSIANGDAIFFLNSGDWFYDDGTVESLVSTIDISGVMVLGRTASVFGTDLYIRPRLQRLGLLLRQPAHQGVIVPMHVARQVTFDEARSVSADTDWILRCLKLSEYVLVPNIISYFQLGGVSNSATIKDLRKWVTEVTGPARYLRIVKAAAKFGLRCLVGRKWLYRILLSRKYEVIEFRD